MAVLLSAGQDGGRALYHRIVGRLRDQAWNRDGTAVRFSVMPLVVLVRNQWATLCCFGSLSNELNMPVLPFFVFTGA